MKVLLVSDTHGYEDNLEKALELEKPQFLCHMGDVEGSEDYIRAMADCPLAMVAGNNDFFSWVLLLYFLQNSTAESFRTECSIHGKEHYEYNFSIVSQVDKTAQCIFLIKAEKIRIPEL